MSYKVVEVFESIQGEGANAGQLAVFIRFVGCTHWSGLKDKREGKGACAQWCDTDFISHHPHGPFNAATLAALARKTSERAPLVVLTGGEPFLQVDRDLIDALHNHYFEVAVETNGTVDPKPGAVVDWVTCSPKLGGDGSILPVVFDWVSELKVVLPGVGWGSDLDGWSLPLLTDLRSRVRTKHHYVQPQDPASQSSSETGRVLMRDAVRQCFDIVRADPEWRLSAQMHKLLDLP